MEQAAFIIILIIFVLTLIFLSGWFSGTETAITHLSLLQVAKMKKHNAKNIDYIIKLRRNMNRTLIAILIGNNIVNISLSAIVAIVADSIFQTIGVSIAIGIITFLIIMFGEITPKSYAIRESEKLAAANAKILYYLMKSLTPLISLFIFLSKHTLKFLKIRPRSKEILVTEENIADLATLGHKEGVLKLIEKDIIHKVFEFGDLKTKEIMVPIENVFSIDIDTPYPKAKELCAQGGFTRVPVVNKKNEIVGFIYTKDFINKDKGSIKKMMREPVYFNVATHITNAFSEMKKHHTHIAVIEDNKDKHVGIITLEDIIEELVGEIEDEYYKMKYRVGVPKI